MSCVAIGVCMDACHAGEAIVARGRRGAWMFAEMLIHFHFGKILHCPYVLLIGEVMTNFSGDVHACVCMLRF